MLFISIQLAKMLPVKIKRENSLIDIDVPRTKIPEQPDKIFLIPTGLSQASIDSVLPESPASKAGLISGDTFIELNGSRIRLRQQATEIISSSPNKTLPLTVLRGSDTVALSVTPGKDGTIGVIIMQSYVGPVELKTHGFFESFYLGWQEITKMTGLTFRMIGKVISGNIEFGKAFGGPIKIAQFAAKSADSGILSFLYFLSASQSKFSDHQHNAFPCFGWWTFGHNNH